MQTGRFRVIRRNDSIFRFSVRSGPIAPHWLCLGTHVSSHRWFLKVPHASLQVQCHFKVDFVLGPKDELKLADLLARNPIDLRMHRSKSPQPPSTRKLACNLGTTVGLLLHAMHADAAGRDFSKAPLLYPLLHPPLPSATCWGCLLGVQRLQGSHGPPLCPTNMPAVWNVAGRSALLSDLRNAARHLFSKIAIPRAAETSIAGTPVNTIKK